MDKSLTLMLDHLSWGFSAVFISYNRGSQVLGMIPLFFSQLVHVLWESTICEASLQNPQNVAQNEMVVILDSNLISLIKLQ